MFWNTFYDMCKKRGTSPTAVCVAIGLSNATSTGWKNGTLPKLDVLIKLADYLECSIDQLAGRSEQILPVSSEEKWRAALNQMSDESRNQLEDYIDFLLWKQGRDA